VTVGQSGGRDADQASPDEPHRISAFQRHEIELYLERAGFGVVEPIEQSAGGEHQWIQILARATLVTPIVGAIAVVFDDTGRVLLSDPVDGQGWCLPGGALEAMETPEDAVVREMSEETGLEVAIDRFVGLYMHPTYRDTDRMLILHAFECHVVGGALHPTAEAPRHGWFDRTALPEPLLRRLEADIQGDMIRDAWARRTGSAAVVARRRYA
jgi:ADP-ribose pyrophosphatase YjhB (NUDIX family)